MFPALPSQYDYQEALQHPSIRFQDAELKQSTVETDPLGLPKVRSGGFALTYKLSVNNQIKAVRCFYRSVPEREARYAAIIRYLSSHQSDHFVQVKYIAQGINVKGSWFPITVMDWVEGDTLETYLVKNIRNKNQILALPSMFIQLTKELEKLNIAHGDLSHRNIIIQKGKMVLIDYDGMYVPELMGKKSTENGSPFFQHPGRNENFYCNLLDHFSSLVIYISLLALTQNPLIWDKYGSNGEGLLFKREDFIDPYRSNLLKDLEGIPQLDTLIKNFRQVCLSNVVNVPKLTEFINSERITLPRSEDFFVSTIVPLFPIIAATQRAELLRRRGEYVSVIGKITSFKKGVTRYGLPYLFLNFGDWRENCFTLVLWSEALDLFNVIGKEPQKLEGQWISVNGILTSYEGRPQIIVGSPTELETLSGIEEAKERLSIRTESNNIPSHPCSLNSAQENPHQGGTSIPLSIPVPTLESPIQKRQEPLTQSSLNGPDISDKLNELYKNNLSNPPSSSTTGSSTIPRSNPISLSNNASSSPISKDKPTNIWKRIKKIFRF